LNFPHHSSEAPGGLTGFQVEVARLFFALPSSAGFLLAGGAALLAQHLTARPTEDLDFFTSRGLGDVTTATEGFEAAAAERGWAITRIRESETFVRLVINGPENLLVDIALDSPPGRPPTVSLVGRLSIPRNWPAARSSPSSTAQRHATSPTSTHWRPDSENLCC
jgi:hypothetical protein